MSLKCSGFQNYPGTKNISFLTNHTKKKQQQHITPITASSSGVHGGGTRAPAPLRSDAKVPLRSSLCDMNDIVDDKNLYRHSLYAEYSICLGHQLAGGHHPSCSKKKKKT